MLAERNFMIPSFPQFKRLELNDKADIESFTRQFPPYSDFNFGSMWCWDTENRVHVCRLAEHLVVQSADDATGEPFYSFLGRGGSQSPQVAETLLARACAEGRQPRLKLVPHEVMALLHSPNLLLWEDRASDDYIVDVGELVALCRDCALPIRDATSTSSCEVVPMFAWFSWILAARTCARR